MIDKKALRTRAHAMTPSIHIGKAGITEAVRTEIKKQLAKHKLIKIKLLKNARDELEDAHALAAEIKATIVLKVGGVIVLHKQK